MMLKKSVFGLLVALCIAAPCSELLARHGGGRFGRGHGGGRHHGHGGGYRGHHRGYRHGGWGHTYIYDSGPDWGSAIVAGAATGIIAGSLISASNSSPSTSNLRDDVLTLNKSINDVGSDVKVLSERVNGLLNRMDELSDRMATLEASAKK